MLTPYRTTNRLATNGGDLLGSMLEGLMTPWEGMGRMEGMLRVPDADVMETENEIRVVAELPGLKAEDIDLSLENNVLTIRGEKREERSEGDERNTWHLSERRYGRFSRSFVLPREVEQERIEARFEDGVLTVTIPKSETARRRRIEITSGDGGARRVEAGTPQDGR